MGKKQTLCVVAYAFKLYTLAWWSNLREWRWFQFQLANTFNPVNFVWDDVYVKIGAKAIKGDVGTGNGFRDYHFHNSVPCNALCVRARTATKKDRLAVEEGHRKWWHNVTANMLRIQESGAHTEQSNAQGMPPFTIVAKNRSANKRKRRNHYSLSIKPIFQIHHFSVFKMFCSSDGNLMM